MKNAQTDLNDNRMDSALIEKIKGLAKEVIKLNEIEGNILQQKAKIQWLKVGDANNSYFYAHIKAKYHTNILHNLRKTDGTIVQNQQERANEVLEFYKKLTGTFDINIT